MTLKGARLGAEGGPAPRPGSRDAPLTVSQLVRGATKALDRAIGTVWVEGEVVSLRIPSSGHVYFALGDRRSQVRAVLWRSDARRLKFRIEEGQVLRCRGHLGIYERDGKFQLYVQAAEPAGLGAEALALEQLKQKLHAEGLFSPERKRPLPHLPRRVGVVTSKSGAAVRDIARAIARRFPVPILVADCQVQGPSAPRQILHALGEIARTDCEVIIVGRGGGSAADLSAFNDERVVRAVAASPVPTISAVGHEIDVTLTDMVADHRAATPSTAGEMAVPVLEELEETLEGETRRLRRELGLRLQSARQEIDHLIGSAHGRLEVAVSKRRRALADADRTLERRHPRARLTRIRGEIERLRGRADASVRKRLDESARRFAGAAGRLDAMSPLRVLERGYALATAKGHVVSDAARVAPGDPLSVRLARGGLECRVEAVRTDDDE